MYHIILWPEEVMKHLEMIDNFDKEVSIYLKQIENEIIKLKEK
jgi:hypothetical protein